MNHARTLWEEGREPGRQVVALAVAVALTAVVVDLALTDRISLLFDLSFVVVCVTAALTVRPADFFTVGVLPPLLMTAVFVVLAIADPNAIADAGDGVVQGVVSGLSEHSEALVTGYLTCLGMLFVRQRVARQRSTSEGRLISQNDQDRRLRV